MLPDLFLVVEGHGADLAEPAVAVEIAHLHFSFETGLLGLSCLLILSILTEKLGLRIGIPGSIFLFFAGLFSHVSGFGFARFPLEEIHVVALSVLLFFSGLSFDRRLLKRSRQLLSSVWLAVFGTILSMTLFLFAIWIWFLSVVNGLSGRCEARCCQFDDGDDCFVSCCAGLERLYFCV